MQANLSQSMHACMLESWLKGNVSHVRSSFDHVQL
jgi:hypothetical protein